MNWRAAFSQVPILRATEDGILHSRSPLTRIKELRHFLDYVHIKFCLLQPYAELQAYPLVDARDLLPSFESNLTEYPELPGFSMVAFNRQLDYFNEVFQFDLLHSRNDPLYARAPENCVLEESIRQHNMDSFLSHLPHHLRETFTAELNEHPIADLATYSRLVPYLSHMDRAHVLSLDSRAEFHLSGIYASLPSDLDTELKRFGLRARKFRPNDNLLYEKNREFMYQFLMELYGYPISSERKTSAAIFARQLHKIGERFLIKALGQSDRTITTLFSSKPGNAYPRVEKTALVHVDSRSMDVINSLDRGGFFFDPKKRVVILRVIYRQHKYDPNNVRQDRALSVLKQEIIHPLTGEVFTSFNLLKDSYSMTLKLNDIVRGEFIGTTVFKRSELVENTESHEKRLKFLHSWLTKHQRRMIGYSEEFYADIVRVLDGYLADPALEEDLHGWYGLYDEVRGIYAFIKQARKIKQLEDLKDRIYRGKRIGYRKMLVLSTDLLKDLKFEFAQYFDQLVTKAIHFSEAMLNDRYLIRTYVACKEEELTPRGLQIRKLYGRLVSLVDELKAIRKTKIDI